MKKVLFLIFLATFTACGQKPISTARDCEFTCAAVAETDLGPEVQGCICQQKSKK